MMYRMLWLIITTTIIMIGIDAFWLIRMKSLYIKFFSRITPALAFNGWAALLSWGLIVTGALVFVRPLLNAGPWWYAVGIGAFYGLIVYGVYNATNAAVFVHYPWQVVLLDTLWGIVLNGILAGWMYWMMQRCC